MNSAIDNEFRSCNLVDARLNKRLLKIVKNLYEKIGSSIPTASGSWADTKAIYRFLDQSRFSEDKIIEGHLQETVKRVFVNKRVRDQIVTIQGLLFHTSLAVTPEGLPIGISALKLWTRKKFKGLNQLRRHINPTRVPIETKESYRWIDNIQQTNDLFRLPSQCVHIGDREADIFELYSECQKSNSSFVIRLAANRKINNYEQNLFESISKESAKGSYKVVLTNKNGEKEEVEVEVRYKKVNVMPPIGKQKNDSKPISGCYIEVREKMRGKKNTGKSRVQWKLLTNLPVKSFKDAYEKIQWYAMRWKIEIFFKILKSGCQTEESKLRSAERLAKFITICSVIVWKVFWLTMLNRTDPKSDSKHVFTQEECKIIDEFVKADKHLSNKKTASDYLIDIAKLGGYLNRKSDPPPGNMVVWRGVSRLNDIIIGFRIAKALMGN